MEKECIFCQIASKKIPAKVVYEDESSLAFLDINPTNPGHTLVIPKAHIETILDIQPEELSNLTQAVKIVAHALSDALNPDGLNILQNNKEIAGQLVPHIHFHLVPRFKDDGVPYFFGAQTKKMEEKELVKIANMIKANIKIPEPKKVEEKSEEEAIDHTEEETENIRREIDLS
jgi:histidine triad (HIT) family protein